MRLRYLFLLVAFVVLVACNKDSEQDWTGMQYYEFEISGKVTDNSGSPIKGISVSASGSSVLTKADGTYELSGQGGTNTTVSLSFADVDIADNGGAIKEGIAKEEAEALKAQFEEAGATVELQ